jgi:hypothetical protein
MFAVPIGVASYGVQWRKKEKGKKKALMSPLLGRAATRCSGLLHVRGPSVRSRSQNWGSVGFSFLVRLNIMSRNTSKSTKPASGVYGGAKRAPAPNGKKPKPSQVDLTESEPESAEPLRSSSFGRRSTSGKGKHVFSCLFSSSQICFCSFEVGELVRGKGKRKASAEFEDSVCEVKTASTSSRFDDTSPAILAMLDEDRYIPVENPFCSVSNMTQHRVTADELFELIKGMNGKPAHEFTDSELTPVIDLIRGAVGVYMQGASAEVQSAVASFYGGFTDMVEEKPRLRAELDPIYVFVDFAGQPPPEAFAAVFATLPAVLGATDASPHQTNSCFSFGGTVMEQRSRAHLFVGHMGSAFGLGGIHLPDGFLPIHFALLQCPTPALFFY